MFIGDIININWSDKIFLAKNVVVNKKCVKHNSRSHIVHEYTNTLINVIRNNKT